MFKSLNVNIFVLLTIGCIFCDGHNDDIVSSSIGQAVNITCAAKDNQGYGSDAAFNWTDGNDERVKADRFIVGADGVLQIADVAAEDTGQYHCYVDGSSVYNSVKTTHYLLVYKRPEYYMRSDMQYSVPDCNTDSVSQYKQYLFSLICPQSHQCPANYTQHCVSSIDHQTNKPTHVLKVEVRFMPWLDDKSSRCHGSIAECTGRLADLARKDIETLQETMTTKMAEIFENMTANENFIGETRGAGCSEGFKIYEDLICLPCKPGTSSTADNNQCDDCSRNSYQNHFAMATCFDCPNDKITRDKAAISEGQCYSSVEQAHTHISYAEPGNTSLTNAPVEKTEASPGVKSSSKVAAIIAYMIIAVIISLVIASIIFCCYICCYKRRKGKKKTKRDVAKSDHSQLYYEKYDNDDDPSCCCCAFCYPDNRSHRKHRTNAAKEHFSDVGDDDTAISEVSSLLEDDSTVYRLKTIKQNKKENTKKMNLCGGNKWRKKPFRNCLKNKISDSEMGSVLLERRKSDHLKKKKQNQEELPLLSGDDSDHHSSTDELLEEIQDAFYGQKHQPPVPIKPADTRIFSDMAVAAPLRDTHNKVAVTQLQDEVLIGMGKTSATNTAVYSDMPWVVRREKPQTSERSMREPRQPVANAPTSKFDLSALLGGK